MFEPFTVALMHIDWAAEGNQVLAVTTNDMVFSPKRTANHR